jgi:hypothetical protein
MYSLIVFQFSLVFLEFEVFLDMLLDLAFYFRVGLLFLPASVYNEDKHVDCYNNQYHHEQMSHFDDLNVPSFRVEVFNMTKNSLNVKFAVTVFWP